MLVEFALITFALYMLVAAMLELGRAVFASQAIQTAADTMARELAVAPLPATLTFEEALQHPYVRARIFDPAGLVVRLDATPPGPALDAYFSQLPIVNQMLRPVMITDLESPVGPVLRYPGALVFNPQGDLTVLIPRVLARAGNGVETIDWVGVVDEVLPADNPVSHFGIDAPLPAFRGLASVRIHYPYQASTLTAFQTDAGGSSLVVADDGSVNDLGVPAGYGLLGGSSAAASPYSGQYGLGRQFAWGTQTVRPWRKLLSAQAVRRREVAIQ